MIKSTHTNKFNAFCIALVYLVFSCGYVTHCVKPVIVNPYALSKLNTNKQPSAILKANDAGSNGTRFLSCPRVISNDRRLSNIVIAVIMLGFICVAGIINSGKAVAGHFTSRPFCASSSDIVVILGNQRI